MAAMHSVSDAGGVSQYARYLGGYRPKAKAKPPTTHQLEERNKRLKEENALFRRKVDEFESEDRRNQASIGSLSGELGKITMRTRQLIQQADDDDRETAIIKETIEVEVGNLREERAAWQRRIKSFVAASAEAENELAELDELASVGVQERRQLQAECLSLQQECEDARVELQETRDLLRQTGGAVERMVKQKIGLEWELQEQTTKHKVLRTMLVQAGHEVANEAEEAYRQREALVAASHREIEKEAAQAESFRSNAVTDQRELSMVNREQTRFEQEIAVHTKELERIEALRRNFEEEALVEHHSEGATKEVLQQSRKRFNDLKQELDKLESQSRENVAKVADMQGERTKLLLGKAQREATKLLSADVADLPTTPAGAGPTSAGATSSGDPSADLQSSGAKLLNVVAAATAAGTRDR
jgi:hypothetical protein